jgi:uncharacterized MAPEG superfamily protein
MPTELFWLTLTVAMTGLFWVPYILDRIIQRGLMGAMDNPKPDAAPHSPWAERQMRAHTNAVENLVIFAALVLTAHALGISNGATAGACVVYFWARLAHYLIYTFGIPVLRTLSFAVGFVCQVVLVLAIFKAM